MAEATKTVEMDVSRDALWKVITDYERYPEFVDGMSKVKVLSRDGGKTRVEYAITILGKDVVYVLDHSETAPDRMSWTFVESNIMKANSGGWVLRDLGGSRTEATYHLALDFKIYVPGLVLNGLVKSTLPKMFESFQKRARG